MAYLVVVMAYDFALIPVPAESDPIPLPAWSPFPASSSAWPMTWTSPPRCGDLKFRLREFRFPISGCALVGSVGATLGHSPAEPLPFSWWLPTRTREGA
jgi:hypothetical protein